MLLTLLLTAALGTSGAARAQGEPMVLQSVDAHGHGFELSSLRGSVVAVTFGSRYTRDEAARVNDALGTRSDVKIVSVVDFMGIPRFVYGYARKRMAEADGRVQHLCDEDGELRRQFGVHPRRHVDIFIVDRDGVLRGRFEGQQQLAEALQLLDEVRAQAER